MKIGKGFYYDPITYCMSFKNGKVIGRVVYYVDSKKIIIEKLDNGSYEKYNISEKEKNILINQLKTRLADN